MTLRTTQLLLCTACLALAIGAQLQARAEADPASTVKPLVVFLLDTSGSMAYESGTATNAAS